MDLRPFSNSLTFEFAFQLLKKPVCADTTPVNLRGSILRNSFLDLRGFPHWTAMPNLELFANAGFPFTRFADLGQTTVIMPDIPTDKEIELYLTLLGHFGAETGYPALHVTVAGAESMQQGTDRDFLVIGTQADQSGIDKLAAAMPVQVSNDSLKVQDLDGFFAPLNHAWWKIKTTGPSVAGNLEASGAPDAVIEGIESPYSTGRSIVVLAIKDAANFNPFMSAFLKTSQSGDISGTVAVLHGVDFQSFRIGNHIYHIGSLPWWMALSLWFTEVPWMVALAVLLVAFVFAVWIRTWLRRRARARLEGRED